MDRVRAAGDQPITRHVRARGESDSPQIPRSVRLTAPTQWHPPEGLTPADVLAVIAALTVERDRLLLRVLWATGARVSEALALRPRDIQRDHLVLPNQKNPNRRTKAVYLPVGQASLPGDLLFWAREHGLAETEPVFFSRKRGTDGSRRALSRQQAWAIVRAASERANIRVLAVRSSRYGQPGEPAPVHPHLFRHARIRQILRTTKSLAIAQKQAGWSRLQLTYLTVSNEEVQEAMQSVPE